MISDPVYNSGMRLFQRENGKWYVEFGRGKKRSLGTADEQTAKRRWKDMEQEILKGKLIVFSSGENGVMALSELFKLYAAHLAADLSSASLEIFELKSRHFMTAVGDKLISALSEKDMDSFVSYLRKRKNKNSTINIGIRSIKACFSWAAAKKQRYLLEDPFKEYSQLKEYKRSYEIVDGKDDIDGLFGVVGDNKRYRIIIALYIYTAARRHSIWQLEWQDIKPNKIIYHTKPGYDVEVPIVEPLKVILKEYDYKNRIGRVVDVGEDHMGKQIKKYLRLAGLGKMRPHDLRHSLASHLLMKGVDVATVSKILGHSSPTVTSQTYSHVLKSHVAESIKKLPY